MWFLVGFGSGIKMCFRDGEKWLEQRGVRITPILKNGEIIPSSINHIYKLLKNESKYKRSDYPI